MKSSITISSVVHYAHPRADRGTRAETKVIVIEYNIYDDMIMLVNNLTSYFNIIGLVNQFCW